VTSVLLFLALFGCQDSENGNPTSIILGDFAKMSLRLEVPTNLNIDTGEITITKGDLEYSQSVDLQDGSATVVFEEIQPGIWQIHVALYDADGFMLYEGSAEAEVHGGETASAHIILTELSGDLEITIEMPSTGNLGPVAYYPFNGNANDESGHGGDGIVYGAMLTEDRFGNPEHAYLFDGENDWIKVDNNEYINVNGYNSLSVCAWVKCQDYDVLSLYAGIVTKWGPGSQLDDQYILHFRSGILAWGLGEEEDFLHHDTADITDWMFLAGVYDVDAERLELYVDGELVESSDLYYSIRDTDRYLEIGGHSNHWYFTGAIDDVRIYDRALSEEEIAELFNEGGAPDYPYVWATEVVDCLAKLDGPDGCNDLQDCEQALGPPNAERAPWSNFVCLGGDVGYGHPVDEAGFIVLRLGNDHYAMDGPGPDLIVYEVGEELGGTAEPYEVMVSSSPGGPFVLLGSGLGITSFDFSGEGILGARYVKIVDRGDLGGCVPGADIDAVEFLHPEPVTD
jgi:hypothetical protein